MMTTTSKALSLGALILALSGSLELLAAQGARNPTATYGGKKFERRNGRTSSGGREVNPFRTKTTQRPPTTPMRGQRQSAPSRPRRHGGGLTGAMNRVTGLIGGN